MRSIEARKGTERWIMYRIVKKQELTTNIYLMDVEAKRVAKSCQP